VPFFQENGVESIHWTMIGACDAKNSAIFSYANENEFIIFTYDLDLGTLLAIL